MVLIVGPRLDRPSAIGVGGRPRAASLAMATALAVGYAVALAELLDLWSALQIAALGAGLVVVGTALVDRTDPIAPFVGHFCFLPGGLLVLAGVAVGGLAGPAAGTVVVGLSLALFGVAGAWADSLGRGGLSTAIKGGAIGTAGVVVAATVMAILLGVGALLWLALEGVLTADGGRGTAAVFLVAGATAIAVRTALGWLPIAALAPREHRTTVARRVGRWRRRALWVGLGGFTAWVVALVLATLESPLTLPPMDAVTAPVRIGLALVTLAALMVATLAVLARRLARFDAATARRLASLAGGLGLLTIPVPLFVWLLIGLAVDSRALVLVLVGVALVVLGGFIVLVALSLVVATAWVGLLPDRAAPLALIAAGVFGAATGSGLAGAPAPVVYAGVAGALFTWDVSEFGLGLTQEVGHVPETGRLEVVHGVAGAGVGLAGLAMALGATALLEAVHPGSGAPVAAVVLAFLGTLAVLGGLRG